MLPDDNTAARRFTGIRWPHGPVCPHCDSRNVSDGCAHPSMRYRCRPCGKCFSVRTGTVMAASKLDCQTTSSDGFLATGSNAAGSARSGWKPRAKRAASTALASAPPTGSISARPIGKLDVCQRYAEPVKDLFVKTLRPDWKAILNR